MVECYHEQCITTSIQRNKNWFCKNGAQVTRLVHSYNCLMTSRPHSLVQQLPARNNLDLVTAICIRQLQLLGHRQRYAYSYKGAQTLCLTVDLTDCDECESRESLVQLSGHVRMRLF